MNELQVKNWPAIARLARKSLAANRTRNRIAVAAIALTTLLFTALFTIVLCLVNTFQQQTFRQVGGDMHGGFKNLSAAQLDALKTDPLITQYGTRLMLGTPSEVPFNKAHVEVSYMDAVYAKGSFCVPEQGTLPAEGTDQLACDTRVLSLLGVTPEIGAKITLTYNLGDRTGKPVPVTGTFTLSGWWAYDPAGMASMVVVPRSYAETVLAGYTSAAPQLDASGTWSLNVYLKSTAHIEQDLKTILASHGYQCDDQSADNYIGIGVNWAFLSSQLNKTADPITTVGLVGILAVILLTGYLIIYNVFQISVAGDIRFYGLLKTIGTTPRQLRGLVRRQALTLSLFGIPLGLALGYGVGLGLAPLTLRTLSATRLSYSASPVIFVGAAAFSLATVLFSCARPGQMAGRVSPIDALRYTEGRPKKLARRTKGGGKPRGMAVANLSRSPKKTVLVVISLSLAVVLMQATYTLGIGFDMQKYLNQWVVSDFVLSDAGYFQSHSDGTLSEEAIGAVSDTGLVSEGGRVYCWHSAECFEPEALYRSHYAPYMTPEALQTMLDTTARDKNGNIADSSDLYGMEPFALDQLTVLAGDLAPLRDPAQNAVAAVYFTDDYGAAEQDSNFAKVGDTITLRYVDRWETFDTRTGEIVANPVDSDAIYYNNRAASYHEVSYTVAACVTMRSAMGFRFFGGPQFVLNPKVLKRDGGTRLLNYLFNTAPESNAAAEQFLAGYTTQADAGLDYESKQGYVDQFEQVRQMFLLLGGALSLVVAVVGVLNFLNAILTSILSRRHEFAMLQAVGMTDRQLNTMLVWEGVLYALLAGGASLVLSLLVGAVLEQSLGKVLWFFTYRFTLLPLAVLFPLFLVLGVALPLLAYRFTARQSVVERLRQTE